MKQKEFDLVMKDLCSRLLYGVKANVSGWDEEKQEEVNIPLRVYSIDTDGYLRFEDNDYGVNYYGIEYCSLFLRPLSSMTDEEKEEYGKLWDMCNGYTGKYSEINVFDWLNRKMFDYRGLIPKGLADEAPEGMYEF